MKGLYYNGYPISETIYRKDGSIWRKSWYKPSTIVDFCKIEYYNEKNELVEITTDDFELNYKH
ncbi:MAG: hypothetical protein ED557_09840 [Balneola sp.]|nr:MAG: hypothetical protein ED557_09840 [Balneola sp.]